MKKARLVSIRTANDKRSTHRDSYTLVLRAGEKGTGKELGRVRVWGDSPRSEAVAERVIQAMAGDYEIIWF